jgi:hypothetical protein
MISSYITDATPAGDFEKLTISTTALGGTSSKLLINQAGGVHKRAVKAFVTVETNSIRVRTDGVDPTSTDGHLFASGSSFTISGEDDVRRMRMIRQSADATVQITYYYNL